MIRSRNADPGSACRVGRLPRYRSYPGIRWQLVELQAGAELIRSTIHNTAWMMGEFGKTEVTAKVAMVDLRRRRVVCRTADPAIRIHGDVGCARRKQFEHIYRHHRRYHRGHRRAATAPYAARMFDFRCADPERRGTEAHRPQGADGGGGSQPRKASSPSLVRRTIRSASPGVRLTLVGQ
ncbi:acyl-CoA dehydrogenase family protein [Rhodococcus ruber]|uniref:acyl-CoA dehydrogenase family protein n=1 Tax=Rhodococcus ruber TaxID=1830 RepID=UPI001D17FE1A|nr:acyl-CoA dehydrogenase family protein [Rhodococcus ruber]